MTISVPIPRTLLEFQRQFPDEASCADWLERVKWPSGFVCPWCGVFGPPFRFAARPAVLRCRSCQQDTSLTAGTVMHASRVPLQVWFWAAHLVTTQTPGMSALQFQRQLGVNRYETAFQMLHKLRAAMVRPRRDQIGGEFPVEIDEAYIGGKTKGKGRGVTDKSLVVGAVEARPRLSEKTGRRSIFAGRIRLRHIVTRGREELEPFVGENILPGTFCYTDGWRGYDNLDRMGYQHKPLVIQGDPERLLEHLPLIHIAFSNLKTWLLGTHHGVSPQHLQAYLNEYVFRFNRRFYPMESFVSLLGVGSHAEAPTYEGLYKGTWTHPNPSGAMGPRQRVVPSRVRTAVSGPAVRVRGRRAV